MNNHETHDAAGTTSQKAHNTNAGPDHKSHSMYGRLAVMLLAATTALMPAHAGDEESERANLARIESELAQIQQMVAAAAKDAQPAQRVNFRYEWLIGDLDVMRRGIQQHMNAPRQPRPVEPLRGDYRN